MEQKLDKILYLLEILVQQKMIETFGETINYPNGEPIQVENLIEKYAEQAECVRQS